MDYTIVDNKRISKLTLGTAQLGFDYGVANTSGKPDHQKTAEILKMAVDHGINCFDTAHAYGESEKEIGSFLSCYQTFSESLIVVSKLPAVDLDETATSNSVNSWVKKIVTESIHQLHIKQIPIYLLHRATDMNAYDGMVIESLLRLKSEGLIGMLGVSVYTPEEVECVLNNDAIRVIQVPLNIFDHRLLKTGLLDKLRKKNIIIFARSIFLQGLFFLDEKSLPHGLEHACEPLKRLHRLSYQWEIDIAELALSFVRDLPGVTSVVIGAETSDQVLKNIELIRSPPLSKNIREDILNTFSDLSLELINPSLWKINS